jgi:hypothetical protein
MAQFKLWAEAARPRPELRLLVGHSNLIDMLMLELQLADFGQPRETPYRRILEAEGGNGGSSRFVEDIEDCGYFNFRAGNADSESSSDSESDSSDSSDDLGDLNYDAETTDGISQRMAPSSQTIACCLTETGLGGGE